MSEIQDTVCAVVVTYNRKQLLIECLEALRRQTRPIQALYIIDNFSNDGTPETLRKHGYIAELPLLDTKEPWEGEFNIPNLTDGKPIKVHYVRMHENTGGAGGFYEGVKKAYEKGYDWLWLMDDDVEPTFRCLEILLSHKNISNILIPLKVSPNGYIYDFSAVKYNLTNPFLIDMREITIIDKFNNVNHMPDFLEIQDFAFEGPLIRRMVISDVGFPAKEFFIFADDTDYALRIRLLTKNKLFLIRDARIVKKILTQDYNRLTWKTYYALRNYYYLHKKYGANFLVKMKPFVLALGSIFKSIVTLNFSFLKIKLIILALYDCYTNNLINRYKPQNFT